MSKDLKESDHHGHAHASRSEHVLYRHWEQYVSTCLSLPENVLPCCRISKERKTLRWNNTFLSVRKPKANRMCGNWSYSQFHYLVKLWFWLARQGSLCDRFPGVMSNPGSRRNGSSIKIRLTGKSESERKSLRCTFKPELSVCSVTCWF